MIAVKLKIPETKQQLYLELESTAQALGFVKALSIDRGRYKLENYLNGFELTRRTVWHIFNKESIEIPQKKIKKYLHKVVDI
jgi:hypothetical protein